MSGMCSRKLLRHVAALSMIAMLGSLIGPWARPVAAARPAVPPPERANSRRYDRPVELPQRRTENSRTYRNPDGSLTTEIFATPIHYPDGAGQLQPIEDVLVAEEGGARIRNAANRYRVTFRDRAGVEAVTFEYQGRRVTMELLGARAAGARWQGARLSYPDVLDSVDLRYAVSSDALKEEIVLKSPEAPGSFTFRIQAQGVRVEDTGDGRFAFRDAQTDRALWILPQPYMRDAAGQSAAVGVSSRAAGAHLDLTLTPDPAWLRDPQRAFPVVIDPSMVLQPDFAAGMDTTISGAAAEQDLNFGYDPYLMVGANQRSLLKFDLSAIPRASVIQSASLRLTNVSLPPETNTTGVAPPAAAPQLAVSEQTSALAAGSYSVLYTYITPQGETTPSPAATITVGEYQAIDADAGPLPAGATGIKVYLGTVAGAERLALTSATTQLTLDVLPDGAAPAPPSTSPVIYVPSPGNAPGVTLAAPAAGNPGFPAGTYYARYTYQNAIGETGPSPAAAITVPEPGGQALQVNVGAFPAGVVAANIYIGTASGATMKLGAATGTATTQTFHTPASLLGTAAPPQAPAVLPDPAVAPGVSALTGNRPFAAGTYAVAYTFYSPNGETAPSPAAEVSLSAGRYMTVTAGQPLPPGATGMRVYVGPPGGPLYLAATQPAAQADAADGRPSVNVDVPPGFRLAQPPATSKYSNATYPTVAAKSLTTPTRLQAGTYYVKYTWVYPDGESTASYERTISIANGQAIEVIGSTLPTGAVGIRVYVGTVSNGNYLAAASWGNRALVLGGSGAPAAPSANTTHLAAPALGVVTLSALPANTYSVSYTYTNATGESAPSPAATAAAGAGQAIQVTLPAFPAGVTGANIYLGTPGGGQRLVRGTTVPGAELTALPDSTAPLLSAQPRGTAGPEAPASAPALGLLTPSTLAAGTYSLRYTFTDGDMETAPSQASTVTVGTGQAVTGQVPPLPAGMTGANIYIGAPGAERMVSQGAAPGSPVRITAPGSGAAIRSSGTGVLAAPDVSTSTGGSFTGDLYVSYSFYNTGTERESPRSPETFKTFSGVLTLTTETVPAWANAVRVYAGPAAGEAKLVQAAAAAPGAPASATVTRGVPAGVSVYAMAAPWAEGNANWLRANDYALWLESGGDYARVAAIASLGAAEQVSTDLTRLVRDWAAGSVPNHGILLKGAGAPIAFASSDDADPRRRPMLSITYREVSGGPQVTLTAPEPGSTLSGLITLAANVTPVDPASQIQRVDFYANNALVGTATAPPFSVVWDTAHMPSGTYTVEARAYDQWGWEGRSSWTPVLSDSFDDPSQLDLGATTALSDPATGTVTLPVDKQPVGIRRITASSVRAPESYPATNLLDTQDDTFWRSPGKPVPDAEERVTLSLSAARTSLSLTIKPQYRTDGLTVKLQALGAAGEVTRESGVTTLDADAKTVSLPSGSSFSSVRLVFSNLKRNLASGLYHAEVKTISSTAALSLAQAQHYEATYDAGNAADGKAATSWVSGGQAGTGAQETLDLDLAGPANALYLKPRAPGVSATVARYTGQSYEPILQIPSLVEGLHTFAAGDSADRVRITFTNLVGTGGPNAPSAFFAGMAELIPYALSLTGQEAAVQSGEITLPAPAGQFLLEATDAQPPGSSIAYSLFDGVQWHAISPGAPLTLGAPAGNLRLRATLATSAPEAVPTLGAWQLYTPGRHAVQVMAADAIPPVAELLTPSQGVLSGTVTLRTATWDNVGVTRVELLADNDEHTVLAEAVTAPFDLTLDTTRLSAGAHLLWVRAYDSAGNVGTTRPPTTTYQALTDTFTNYDKVDINASQYAAITGGAARNSTGQPRTATLSGSGTRYTSISTTPGVVEVHAPGLRNSSGNCVSGNARLYYETERYDSTTDTYYTTTTYLAEDQLGTGECRDLFIRYLSTYSTKTLNVRVYLDPAGGTYAASVNYFGSLTSGYDYGDDTLVSIPVVTAGPIAGVTLKVTESKPSGTGIDYYASADDGRTWQPITPGQYTTLDHGGNKLRLMAVLRGAAGSGYAYNNLTPTLSDWTVDVTQYLPAGMVTVSQVDPPRELRATLDGSQVTLTWQPSAAQGVTYNAYRSSGPGAQGKEYLVATGITGTTLVDGANLLRNSSFEGATLTGTATDWSGGATDVADAFAGSRSLRLATGSATQVVNFEPALAAGTAFGLSARAKGQSVRETSTQALGITLTYTDNTTATVWGSVAGGTFDWDTFRTAITAAKPVKSAKVTLQKPYSGTVWFDAVQLDTQGAETWVEGGIDPAKAYYYRVTAVQNGVESAPSNEAVTAAGTVGGLGIKGFWPYAGVQMAGGEGYVNLANGNLAYAATDLIYPTRRLALTFGRTYNAQGAGQAATLGFGWDHNFNWALTAAPDGGVTLKEGDGSQFTFTPKGDGVNYMTPPGARMRLVKGPDGYTLTRYDNNLLYVFDAGGRLLRISEPHGNALTLGYDVAGRLAAVTGPTGEQLAFEYNAAGYIAAVVHPGDRSWQVRYEYDGQGNLVRATDLEGNTVLYGYDEAHRLVTVTDAHQGTTQISYTGSPGAVARATYADGTAQDFAYGQPGDSGWSKTTVTDARGFAVEYQVDANGLLRKQTFPHGTADPATAQKASALFVRDDAWNVTEYTDPRGKVYRITYDGYGNITSVTDPLGNVSRNAWSVEKPYPGAQGHVLNVLARSTDPLGNQTVFDTDSRGDVIRVEDALGQVTAYTYDASGLMLSATDAAGHTMRYEYYTLGWPARQVDPLGGVTTYTYDIGGNPRAITDPTGHTTSYVYDKLGREKEIILPDGGRQTFLYDGAGNLIRSTDPAGAMAQFQYDSRNRVVAAYQWAAVADLGDLTRAVTTRYEYDAVGNPVAVTDPLGKRTTSTYDGVGRSLSVTDPLGKTTTYTYDAAGNMLSMLDPNGNQATAAYDDLNRQAKVTIPQDTANSLVYTTAYDALGRTTQQKDALGNTTTYAYDAISQLLSVTDPMGFTTRYVYDAVGNRVAVIDAQRRTTGYLYDDLGRLVGEDRPDGSGVRYQYDAAGRMVAHTNARNQTTRYRYDAMGRPAEVSYPSGRWVSYAYDPAGRRTAMTDWNGTTRYRYDLLGRPLAVEDPWGHQVNYEYDPAGHRTRLNLRYTGVDLTWLYEYDDAGRPSRLQSPGVGAPNTFTYDAGGRLTKLNYANGDTVQYSFNKANEVTSIIGSSTTSGTILSFSYAYDKAGRRTSITRSGAALVGSGSTYYKYDADSRLTTAGATSTASDREYYYDLVGNRHALAVNSGNPTGVSTYVYDTVNRLLEEFGPRSSQQGGGTYRRSYTYDADGSQIRAEEDGKEVSLYAYDEAARLVRATNALGQETEYTYDGDGRQVRRQGPSGATIYIYDGSEVLAEADATGAVQLVYTRTPGGRLISQWQKGETFWYHLDGLGSTIALTDESGKIRNKYGYDEFGNLDPASSEEILNRYTFTGQAWDPTVGLYNYKARYYDPGIGRFLTQDTWRGSPWQPWTQNLYSYVGNNPVNYIDPTGHYSCLKVCIEGGGTEPPNTEEHVKTVTQVVDLAIAMDDLADQYGVRNAETGRLDSSQYSQWAGLIYEESTAAGVDPFLIAAIMMQESRGNPNDGPGVGLMQIDHAPAELRVNHRENIRRGIQIYLDKVSDLKRFKLPTTLEWTIQAYNYGAGGMRVTDRAMQENGWDFDTALRWVHDNYVESKGRMVKVDPGTGHFGTPTHYKAVVRFYGRLQQLKGRR